MFGDSQAKLKEKVRKGQRDVQKEIRNIERDIKSTEKDRIKMEKECKKYAEKGNMDMVRDVAKQIVRTKRQVQTMNQLKSNLIGVKLQLSQAKAAAAMQTAMKQASKVMEKTNKMMNPSKIQKQALKFQQAQQRNELTMEIVGDVMDDAFDTEAEEDELVDEVLRELQIKMTGDLLSAPTGRVGAQVEEKAPPKPMLEGGEEDKAVNALEARLRNLNKGGDDDDV